MKKPLMAGVLLLPVLMAGSAAQRAQPQRPPNILLIQADDLGYGDLSAYGQAQFKTPALDRLAREGMRFTQYYAGSTVCAPSRASLMTGMHTGRGWIRGNGSLPEGDTPLRPEEVTIAEVLRDAGYRTALIGKWGLGQPGTSGEPTRQGFEYAFGPSDQRHAHRQFTDHLWRNGERVAVDLEKDYTNDLFTKEAEAFIERSDPRPFFVYLNYTVPHAELRVPDDSIEPFRGRFPETPFVNAAADARQAGARPDVASLGYRSQPGAARGVRRDDRPHGPGHRAAGRSAWRAGHRSPDAGDLHERQRPASRRGRRPGVLQELGSAARHQAGPLRGRHPRAEHRALDRHDPRRPRQRSRLGALGRPADARRSRRARKPRRAWTGCRCAARCGANVSRRILSCTGSFTSAAFSRPCGWAAGRPCG